MTQFWCAIPMGLPFGDPSEFEWLNKFFATVGGVGLQSLVSDTSHSVIKSHSLTN